MKNLGVLEKFILVFLMASIGYALYVYFTDASFFEVLVMEDGFYETLTSVFLFIGSFTLIGKFFKYQNGKKIAWKFGVLLMAVGLFFGGGEEISWGQRIFNISSSEFFAQHNAQQETNLHNMMVGEVKLNKLIFSNLMSIAFGVYFLVLPVVWKKSAVLKKLLDQFGISVPRAIHVIIFIIATLLILIPIDHSRKWEIWEYVFALIMFLIVFNPWNSAEIFSKTNP